VNGQNIKDVTLNSLRAQIGYVPQQGILFSGTVKSNICYGDANGEMTDEAMQSAAAIAQAADFIDEKPEKYDDAIAQGGVNVSGGQRQRLSIARAVAQKPRIYIFDDSFSALDYKTDSALRKAIKSELSGVTTLIVAQRIGTIKNAEQIVVLNDGEIVGIGRHKDLLESCEVYKQIALSQLSQEELDRDLALQAERGDSQ
jgi:ATP-binding cassette subfamily B protein